MKILEVKNLTKKYPKFTLDHVSFDVEGGQIIGFIGRNGAGKTTTIKGIMNLIHLDEGEIIFNGENGLTSKQKEKIALLINGVDFFPERSIKTLTNITKRFYKSWNEDKYQHYLNMFGLDPNKKIKQLSQGMKIKYLLCVALSHDPYLLILDEPTSGLDPISREEILEIFLSIVEDENKAILFSTHITSDLEKVADKIIYIRNGKICVSSSQKELKNRYKKIRVDNENIEKIDKSQIIGFKKYNGYFEGLIENNVTQNVSFEGCQISDPTIEEIMIFLERGGVNEKLGA